MNAIFDFDSAFCSRLCLTLLHSIWQFGLLAVIAFAVSKIWRRNPETEYSLNVAALVIGLIAIPVTFSLVQVSEPLAPQSSEAASDPDSQSNDSAVAIASNPNPVFLPGAFEFAPVAAEIDAAESSIAPVADPTEMATESTEASVASTDVFNWRLLTGCLVGLYLTGVAIMLVRLVRAILKANRIATKSKVIESGVFSELIEQLSEIWSVRFRPSLAIAEDAIVPKVVGIVRPTILLPASAITGMTVEELEMVLVHELAHVRRHDMIVNLVQRLAEVALFFNPALWFLSRRISILREYCCDEIACKTLESNFEPKALAAGLPENSQQLPATELRTRYAIALLRVIELSQNAPNSDKLTSLAASGRSPSELRRRVARLFGEPVREPLRISRGTLLTFSFAALLLFAGPAIWHLKAENNTVKTNLSSVPVEQDEHLPTSKRYVTEFGEVEVSLAMENAEMMMSEPGTLIVSVKNLSDKKMMIVENSYRNSLGRSEDFKVTAMPVDGHKAIELAGHINFGGMTWHSEIAAGETWKKKLFMPNWLEFNAKGDHRVACNGKLRFFGAGEEAKREAEPAVEFDLSVPVKIVLDNMEKMGLLIDELAEAAIGEAVPNKARDDYAMKKLLAIDDHQVIDHFLRAVAAQDYSLRFSALSALSKFNSDDAMRGIEIGLATSFEDMRAGSSNDKVAKQLVKNIRHSASIALSRSPHPKAEERLLSLWDDPNYAIKITVLHRLGKLKDAASFELLQKMTEDRNETVRNEAIRYVKLRQKVDNERGTQEKDEEADATPVLRGTVVNEKGEPLPDVGIAEVKASEMIAVDLVTRTLPQFQKPNGQAEKPVADEFKEVAIVFNSGKALLDLDNDKTLGPMQQGASSDVPEFDLFAGWGVADGEGRSAITVLTAQVAKLVSVENKQWKSATAKQVVATLARHESAKKGNLQTLSKQGAQNASTWIVQTKQGGVALIQVEYKEKIATEFGGEQKGFVVRYKLVPVKADGDATATRSINIRVVDTEGKALQGASVFRNHVYELDDVERPTIENKTYKTEMGGQVAVMLNGETVDLRLWASMKGYVRMHAMWAEKFQSDGGDIPDEFTFVLSKETKIGGTITDENGKPIAGVKVEVQDTHAGNSILPDDPGKRPIRDNWITGEKGVLTNAEGRWEAGSVPSDKQLEAGERDREGATPKIQLRITHPDYHADGKAMFPELGDEVRWGEVQDAQGITLKSLREKSAAIKLKRRAEADAKFSKRWPWPHGIVNTVTIDTHFENEVDLEKISAKTAISKLSASNVERTIAELDWKSVPDFEAWKKTKNENLQRLAVQARDTTPQLQVVQFSKEHVHIKIVRQIAQYRWHHHYGVAKYFEIKRSAEVDELFKLHSLEEKYLTRYKGVGIGTAVMDARKKLGEPDFTLQTSAVGWYTDYYLEDDVVVFYQNMSVASVTRGIPDDVKKEIEAR